MASHHQHSTTHNEWPCGLLGVILDLLVLNQLAVISIAVILSISFRRGWRVCGP